MAYVENDGVSLYYETHGSEGPGLVFAHGAGGNATSWYQQVPEFAGRYRVVVFDHRGFARSPCPAPQRSAAYFEGDLIAIMDAADLASATVVCQSMGGWTGVRAAVHHPSRVDAVFLANTPGAIHTPSIEKNWEQLNKRLEESGGLLNRAISQEFMSRDPVGALLYQQISAYNTQSRPNLRDTSVGVSVQQVVDSGVPFQMLASDLDPLFPPELLSEVADSIGAALVRINGAGHSTYFEKPEAFNAVLDEYLRNRYM